MLTLNEKKKDLIDIYSFRRSFVKTDLQMTYKHFFFLLNYKNWKHLAISLNLSTLVYGLDIKLTNYSIL